MSVENFSPFKNFRYDLPASLVVFLVALPLCLGVAFASGVPLFSGIVAGAVGGIVVGAISKSPLSVSGPAAGLTTIVAAAVIQFPAFETFLLAVFLAGLMQLILGLVGAGIIGDFIPSSVIKGMLAAIGLILILKQVPHMFGRDKDYEGDFFFYQLDGENTFSEIWHAFDSQFTPGALVLSILSILFLFLWDYWVKKGKSFAKMIPGQLIVVVAGVLANLFFQASFPALEITADHKVNIPVSDSLSAFIGQFKLISFSEIGNHHVWLTAFTLCMVASIETLLSIEAIDRLDPFKRNSPTNRELVAQGVGNMLCGLIGGMPVTSVIVRSSANVTSGARTKASTILHGLLLILCVALIPGVLNQIPLASLAAILIVTGYKLTKPSLFIDEYLRGWMHIAPFFVTILAILFTNLLVGVGIGILVAAIFIIWENFRAAIIVVQDKHRYLIKVRKDLSFIHKFELKKVLNSIPENSIVWLNLTKTNFVDLDNAEMINNFVDNAPSKNISVEVIMSIGQAIEQHIHKVK